MSHIPFTLLAYFLNSIAVTIDKFLITKRIPDPIIYIFYYSLLSLLALFLIPLAKIPTLHLFLLSSIYTVLWTTGAYFMFKALQIGQISRVIPLIGTLIALTLLIDSAVSNKIAVNETWAVMILILGLVSLTFPDWKGKIKVQEVAFEVFAALFFALSYIVLRQAYLQADFFTVFVFSRPILIPIGLMILIAPQTRKLIFPEGTKLNHLPKITIFSTGVIFILGQIAGGLSEVFLTFSISLANPALVNSLQGTQYIFLLIFTIILAKRFPTIFKERFTRLLFLGKIVGIILIASGLYMLAFGIKPQSEYSLGITYSTKYAKELGLSPFATYQRILDELKVKKVRLPLYWDEIEPQKDKFDQNYLVSYLNEARIRNIDVILVLGLKQPRWPECHIPEWAKGLSRSEREKELLELLEFEVNQYKSFASIKAWQVENEPLVNFGICPESVDKRSFEFLKEEVALVNRLNPSRLILLTDSGELSDWSKTPKLAEIFGTTLYRKVWSPLFGAASYPVPPMFYQLKADFVKTFINPKLKSVIISELQAEPWQKESKPIKEISPQSQVELFSANELEGNINFAKETGFKDIYLWGVEWWYFMREKGHPEYIEQAKPFFQ